MLPDYLTEGTKIDISPIVDDLKEQNEKIIYYSQIQSLLPNGLLEISMPFEGGRMKLLQQGFRYRMVFYTQKGNYTCVGKVIDRYKAEHLYMVSVQIITELVKLQRREYFRIPCGLDFEYALLPQINLSLAQQETIMDAFLESEQIAGFHSGRSLDISGGGIRFISDHPMDPEAFLRLRLHLEFDYGIEDLCMIGKLLSSTKCKDVNDRFENRIEFFRISVDTRETIIRFIFNEERKARKQGKG